MVAGQIPLAQEEPLNNNGNPMIGAFMYYYEPDSMTLKSTYQDPNLTILNTNPVLTDGFGRFPSMFGTGSYKQILQDVNHTQIWAKIVEVPFPSANISTAIGPLLGDETTQQFVDDLGIPQLIQTAINNASLLPGPTGPIGNNGPTGPTGPAGSSASNYIPNFTSSNPGYISFPNLNNTSSIGYIMFGSAATNSGGTASVSFPIAFTSLGSVVATQTDSASGSWFISVSSHNNGGFTVITSSPLHGGGWQGGPITFFWQAIGYI